MGQVVLGAAGRSLGNRQGTIAVGVGRPNGWMGLTLRTVAGSWYLPVTAPQGVGQVFAGLDGSVEGSYRVYNGQPPPPPGLSPVPINLATRLSRSNQNGAPSDTAAAVTNHPSTCAIQPPVGVKDASHHLVSQELLQNLGSQATRPRILRDRRHDIVEGLAGPPDITQAKIEEEIQLATILVRRGSIGVSQIRIHGDRDCVRHVSLPSRGEFVDGCLHDNE